ncbi:MAG: transcription termination factor Rho [Planctomycetes bacterium]|nr:transcription termination factor Rho [Planctomycetota bacterium]
MATKKTTGSKEPKAPKAAPAKSSSASRKATPVVAAPAKRTARSGSAATKAAASSTPARKTPSKTTSKTPSKTPSKTAEPTVKNVAKKVATSPAKAVVTGTSAKAPKLAPATPPSASASTKATARTGRPKAKAPARSIQQPASGESRGPSTTVEAAEAPVHSDSVLQHSIAQPDAAAASAAGAASSDMSHDLEGALPSASSTTDQQSPADPAAPTVKPIFRRVGNAWMKFDPSDLDGIAKAEAEAAAIAANPDLAPPPPPAPKRQEPRHQQQPRPQHQQRSAAAVLDGSPDQPGDDADGEHEDGDDGQAWEGGGDHHHAPEPPAPIEQVTGVLDLSGSEARLRQFGSNGWVPSHDEPQVPMELVQRFNLRNGNQVTVNVQMIRVRKRRGPKKLRRTVVGIESVEGLDPSAWSSRPPYGELTSIDPQPRMHLEYRGCPPACRLIDLFCPIGFGTRGLIVAPPKAGKTILLQQIAHGIKHNHPQVELIALLIDERPEEVTDFRRNVPALVLASSNDQDLERHTQMGIMAIERARRLFEAGKDVVVLLDSLTRLGRAFNNNRRYSTGGRTMSGGLDSRALEIPKQLFGAARKAEEGGSLTIIATCLVDTGSRADQVIFEEFKGTGNMELILDRSIAERRVYPAINLAASGTRKEHLLMGEREMKTMTALRRRLMSMPPFVQVEQLVAAVNRTTDNETLVRGSGG